MGKLVSAPRTEPPVRRRVAGQRRRPVVQLPPPTDVEPAAAVPAPESRRGRRVIAAAVAIAVIAAAAAVGYGMLHGPRHSAAAPVDGTARQAEQWVAANLPSGTRLATDITTSYELSMGGGGLHVDVLGTNWRADEYLVATPLVREEAADQRAVADALASSMPVAVFGAGTGRVEVRRVSTDGATALVDRWRAATESRASTGQVLLTNPHLTTAAPLRPMLRDGSLDARAATLVALLAARTTVALTAASHDPATVAGAVAVHQVTVSLGSPIAMAQTLAELPPDYKPAHVTRLGGSSWQLTWPVSA